MNPSHIQADIAAAMLHAIDDPAKAGQLLASLSPDEVSEYLAASILLGAAMVETETRVLMDHGVRTGGPVLALLARTITARAERG